MSHTQREVHPALENGDWEMEALMDDESATLKIRVEAIR
jgi:hypothetical protein